MSEENAPDGGSTRPSWSGMAAGDLGRALGRIEAKQDQLRTELHDLKAEGRGRDGTLKDLTERVRADAHKANNTAQVVTGRIEGLQASAATTNLKLETVSTQLADIAGRVTTLEAPVKDAIAQRDRRWAQYKRWGGWLTVGGVALWAAAKPVYDAILPVFLRRWLDGPPH